MAQYNANGDVAVKYFQPIQKLILAGNVEYVFVPKVNISMAWINPKHVDIILSMTRKDCNCSGGTNIFRLANELDVRLWEGKGR